MKFKALVLVTLVFSTQLIAQEKVVAKNIDKQIIEDWLTTSKVPAMALATIEEGKIKTIQVQGKISETQKAKLSTLFDVASLTKTITTLVALKLVENKSWNLDEPLYHY